MTEPQDRGPDQPGTAENLPQPYLSLAGPSALQRYRRPVSDEPDEETFSLERYVQILLRRKWLLLSVALSVLFLAALQVLTVTPIYQATVTLQIDPEGEKVLPYEGVESNRVSGSVYGMSQYLWTQAEILKSRRLAERVAEKLSLGANEAEPVRRGLLLDIAAAPRNLASSLLAGSKGRDTVDEREADQRKQTFHLPGGVTVRPLRNTRLIEVSFESPDPELSARVANTLGEEFIELHLEGKFDATTRATVFLEKQLEDLQIKVEKSEQALLRYAQQQNIVNIGERDTISRKRLADLSDELTRAETAFLSEQARHAATRAATLESFPEILKTEAMRDLEERLSTASSQLTGLSSVYGPEWPTVKTLRSEIAGLEVQLDTQKRRALLSARQESALAGDRLTKLELAVAKQTSLVDLLNEDSVQYNVLKRESDSNKELYQGLLRRLKEAGVSAGLRSSNIRIADPATVPSSTVRPKKARSLGLAMVLGLFLGTGLVFLVDAFDNTLKSADDVTDTLGLPALGVVPTLNSAGASRRWKFPGSRQVLSRFPLLAFGDDRIKGRSRVIEAYRSLRTSILLSHSDTPPQVILVTSALPGEGKTTTAANIAIALAQTGARALLMDLDMRKPMVASLFEMPSDQGLSTYLSGNSDLSSQIKPAHFDNLFVLPAGPTAPNPGELIGSKRMVAGLEVVREYFTHVVIDSPPALEISDAVLLSPSVDGVIVVARAGQTPRNAVGRCAAQIMAVGGSLLGVLLNGADLDQTGYGSYGSYGGYYSRYFEDQPKNTA